MILLVAALIAVPLLGRLVNTMFAGLVKAVLVAEIRGGLSDRIHGKVDVAAASLPSGLADDLAAEWHAELAALEEQDRLVTAWYYAHGLGAAAKAIVGDAMPTPLPGREEVVGLARRLQPLSRVMRVPIRWGTRLIVGAVCVRLIDRIGSQISGDVAGYVLLLTMGYVLGDGAIRLSRRAQAARARGSFAPPRRPIR